MTLAVLSRNGSEDLVLFLHGLGCVKENFAKLWKAPELAGAALVAPDLPGHGTSQGLSPEAWTMEGMTEAVAAAAARRSACTSWPTAWAAPSVYCSRSRRPFRSPPSSMWKPT